MSTRSRTLFHKEARSTRMQRAPLTNTWQGHDLEMGTNCLGPFLLNHYLEPILKRTAAATNSPLGVRVVWLASMIAVSVPPGGVVMDSDGIPKVVKVREFLEKG